MGIDGDHADDQPLAICALVKPPASRRSTSISRVVRPAEEVDGTRTGGVDDGSVGMSACISAVPCVARTCSSDIVRPSAQAAAKVRSPIVM